jgi:hypothetical protein
MRGDDQQQDGMFSYISPNKRVPQDHPLRSTCSARRWSVLRITSGLATNRLEGEELALFAHELLSREIDIRGLAGCGWIPANTQTIERELAASFKPPPDQYQN